VLGRTFRDDERGHRRSPVAKCPSYERFNRSYALQPKEILMKAFTTTLMCACLALAAGPATAADDAMSKTPDTMTKNGAMNKDGMADKNMMTLQQCKDHMAMSKKDGMKKDDAMMKNDAMCDDMMKKDSMMKKDNMSSDTMKKQ
jgi:hypothetical protein